MHSPRLTIREVVPRAYCPPAYRGKKLVRRQKPARAAGHTDLPTMGMAGHNQIKSAVPVIFGELRPV